MARKPASEVIPKGRPRRLASLGLAAGLGLVWVAACGGQTPPANLVDLPSASTVAVANQTVVPTPLATEPPATPEQTPVPIVEPSAPPETTLAVTFTSLTSPIDPGRTATAKVKTSPRAECSIEVEYKSGPSTAAGLDPKTANATGAVSWSWKVGINTSAGRWPVTVSCSKGDAFGSAIKYLTVR
jgi:hypothetical protein